MDSYMVDFSRDVTRNALQGLNIPRVEVEMDEAKFYVAEMDFQ